MHEKHIKGYSNNYPLATEIKVGLIKDVNNWVTISDGMEWLCSVKADDLYKLLKEINTDKEDILSNQ